MAIECVCRFPGVSSQTYHFAAIPSVGDEVFLHVAGGIATPCVVESREFNAVGYPNGYVDTSKEPSVVLVMRRVG